MKSIHLIIYMSLVLSLFCNNLYAQNENDLNDIFNNFNTNKLYSIDAFLSSSNEDDILKECTKRLYSANIDLRYFAYEVINKIILISDNPEVQIKATYLLCNKGLNESESSLVYVNLLRLLDLPKSYFDFRSVNIIKVKMFNKSSYFSLIVRLIGNLNITDVNSILNSRLHEKNKYTTSEIWNMRLALAKLGDSVQLNYCISKLKSLEINDDIIFSLIPDMIYLKDMVIFDYLFDEILKDKKNCTSLNPDNEISINCAFRLIELVAPYIIDFPVRVGFSGDLEIDNYPLALIKVRKWIIENKDKYQIK